MKTGTLYRLLSFIKPYWPMYVGITVLMVIGIGTEMGFAWFLMQVTDAAVIQDTAAVWRVLYFGIGLTIAIGAQTYGSAVLRKRADSRLQRDIKGNVLHHILRLPMGTLQHLSSGDLISRLTNDINAMGSTIGTGLINLIRDPLMGVVAFVFLLKTNWVLALLTGSAGPLSILVATLFGKAMRSNSARLQHLLGAQNGFLTDVLSTLPVVKAFCAEKRLFGTYESDNDAIVDVQIQGARLSGSLDAVLFAMAISTFLVTIGIGGLFVAQGRLTVGSLVAFLFLIERVTRPFHSFSNCWGRLQRSLAAGERIFDIMDMTPETPDLPAPVTPETNTGHIEFAGVHFAYGSVHGDATAHSANNDSTDDNLVLHDFTVKIHPGTVVALVGPSGAGKTTVFNLLLRFWHPNAGQIRLNGQSITDFDSSALRSLFSIVPQETALFRGTVRENIAFGRPEATETDIVHAAKMANAHDFIMALPDAYGTELGERGQRLSGGQRQRIAIARALLKDAPILLLDEATSALDVESEAAVQQALGRLMVGRTTIVIAHRLTTVHNADHILVMEQGRIVEQGSHRLLIAKQGRYATLYDLQFGDNAPHDRPMDEVQER